MTFFSIAALWLGCILLADRSAAAELAAANKDPIATLVQRLSASPLWMNGRNPIVALPATATTDEVLARVFEQISFTEGRVTQYRILETRLVQIPETLASMNTPATRVAQGLPYTYMAALVRTDFGDKIVLLKYENSRTGWWCRVYDSASQDLGAQETRVPVAGGSLYARTIGRDRPTIVLHGGPDFDHAYLLPDLDRLQDVLRLVYYDQRGRGRSAENVRPQGVTLSSDLEDIEAVRRHFGLDAPGLLAHSWGTVLTLEYAVRYPTRISHLVLMNPAPASARDFTLLRTAYVKQLGAQMDRQREIMASEAYQQGDPEAVAARYRIHFAHALQRREDYEKLMTVMKAQFVQQGSAGILEARAVEDRLMQQTWQDAAYDLLPRLRTVNVPTLVIAGDHDFIPAQIAEHVAQALPNATLVTLKDCGHFAYLECPEAVHRAVSDFLRR
jgi:proline iminopeptidase